MDINKIVNDLVKSGMSAEEIGNQVADALNALEASKNKAKGEELVKEGLALIVEGITILHGEETAKVIKDSLTVNAIEEIAKFASILAPSFEKMSDAINVDKDDAQSVIDAFLSAI